jgi:hypothetical protein
MNISDLNETIGTAVVQTTPPSPPAPQSSITMPLLTLVANVYTLPILAAVGFVLNIVCLIVLLHPKLSGQAYKNLLLKTLIQMLTQAMLALSALTNCVVCEPNPTYAVQILRSIVIYFGNAATSMAAFEEIFLSYDRLLTVKREMKCMPKLPFIYTTTFTICTSLLINVPIIFSTSIVRQRTTTLDRFVSMRSQLADSLAYRIYAILLNLGQSFLTLVLLLLLNSLIVLDFDKYIQMKNNNMSCVITKSQTINNNLQQQQQQQQQRLNNMAASSRISLVSIPFKLKRMSTLMSPTELSYNQMVLVGSVCFTFTRLVHFVTAVTSNVMQLQGVINAIVISYMSIVSFTLTMIYYGSNLFFYLWFNKRIRHYFRRIFRI